jgi:ABC-type transport system involved in cytochrome bd biosynthesis fused ATPase/permease subunit
LRSERRFSMARILVMSEKQDRILLDEYVHPAHIEDEHTSLQILERLAWAIKDASALKDAPQSERLAVGN